MIVLMARWLGNEKIVQTLVSSTPALDGISEEQLSEQLTRDGIENLYLLYIFPIIKPVVPHERWMLLLGQTSVGNCNETSMFIFHISSLEDFHALDNISSSVDFS